MRKLALIFGVVVLLTFTVTQEARAQQVLPGGACSEHWGADLMVMADTLDAGVQTKITLRYIPFQDDDTRWTTEIDLATISSENHWTLHDVVCDWFPQAEGTTGVLIVEGDFSFDCWLQSWNRKHGYGQGIQPVNILPPGAPAQWYANQWFPTRVNILAYNSDPEDYVVFYVGRDFYVLEPLEAQVLVDQGPHGYIEVYNGLGLRLFVSQVNPDTGDALGLPLVETGGQ